MLTIIVPFFDEVLYLSNALNSIRSQRIDDVQIIVVNDNPDQFNAGDLAALGVTGDIELIEHATNLGLSAARNSGLTQARGRFIGFLDSDDYYTLGGLAHQLARAQSTNADITHGQTWFTNLGSSEAHILHRDATFFTTPRTCGGLATTPQAQFITSSWSSLYSAAFLEKHDLRFDPEQTKFEDRLFVLSTVTRAEVITFTGRPSHVWRRRAGSISVTATTPQAHLLQLQLLEKCLTLIRQEVAAGRLAPIFEKRELFQSVTRLIWNMDLIEAITERNDPVYQKIATRIVNLLGSERFGQEIFDDEIMPRISRVGLDSRKGRIPQAAFSTIHRAIQDGDFTAARREIDSFSLPMSPPLPARVGKSQARRLVLHLGLHKTGTTFIQHHLMGHRDALLQQGVLVPLTGFEAHDTPPRAGATSGHQGLVRALHHDQVEIWSDLAQEIKQSGADTVIISCENMGFPTMNARRVRIAKLAKHLGKFEQTDLIVLARRADAYVEAFYREQVANGARLTALGLPGFIADYGDGLCNLPALFGPFEAAFGTKVRFGDFDALAVGDGLWPGFATLAGLPPGLPVLDVARYPSYDRDTIEVLHLLNSLVPDADLRSDILSGWFSLNPASGPGASLISPIDRAALLDKWQTYSRDFAADRGYQPDLNAARASLKTEVWQASQTVPAAYLSTLVGLASQTGDRLSSQSGQGTISTPERRVKTR